MTVLFWGFVIFCLAFVFHLAIWKIRIPEKQINAILKIYFGVLMLSLLALWKAHSIALSISLPLPINLPQYLHISLLFISLTLAYIVTYSALEADSPSLVMVMKIATAGSNGLNKNEFDQSMNDDILVKPRIMDLVRDNLAYVVDSKFKLTSRGSFFIHIIIYYRKLLNLPKGG